MSISETPAPEPKSVSHGRRNAFAIAVFLVVVILFSFTFKMAVVRGDSMLPTYHDGQYLLVNKMRALTGKLHRGDVVLISHANDVLVKRVAYLPGDVIPAEEYFSFMRVAEFFDIARPGVQGSSFPSLKVPENYIVVLGDNRRVSEDSRLFGPVKEGDVIGRVVNAPPKP
jgi:signal peptidase I